MKIGINIQTLTQGQGLGGIVVGTSLQDLYEIWGEPDFPPARLRRKSKLLNHVFGNVTVMSERGQVICISLDFHGNRENKVDAEDLKRMTYAEWLNFAVRKHYNVSQIGEITSIMGKGFLVNISASGEIGLISFK